MSLVNNLKGKFGELLVHFKLNPLIFGKVEHKQINNWVYVDDNGYSHQIDHIEIRHNGIFCIETKNYSGWIFGNENSREWTQVIYKQKNKMINPLKQNKSHLYHIGQVLENKFFINSVVVMVQNNADKIECSNVINLRYLKTYLKKYNDGTSLSTEEMNEIYNTLINAKTNISNRTHVNNIKQMNDDIANMICPRCGSPLVERSGEFGSFIGCSNYPKCKFKIKK